MMIKSAQQGYGPAELGAGQHYLDQAAFKGNDRAQWERVGVRYTSRAAFKGIADAQSRLSNCYVRGTGVRKDPVMAYGWMAIAVKTAGGPQALSALIYKSQLDYLIAHTSSDDIARGQQFADGFRVGMPNFVETEVLISQLKLAAFYTVNGNRLAVVNQTRFFEGETKSLKVEQETLEITCRKIEGKTATFTTGDYEFQLTLPLK